jgi:hypothetical protein
VWGQAGTKWMGTTSCDGPDQRLHTGGTSRWRTDADARPAFMPLGFGDVHQRAPYVTHRVLEPRRGNWRRRDRVDLATVGEDAQERDQPIGPRKSPSRISGGSMPRWSGRTWNRSFCDPRRGSASARRMATLRTVLAFGVCLIDNLTATWFASRRLFRLSNAAQSHRESCRFAQGPRRSDPRTTPRADWEGHSGRAMHRCFRPGSRRRSEAG